MTIRDYKKDALSKGYDDWDFNSYLDETCSNKLDMYYSGWECDTTLWIMSNSDKICTSHGDHYIMSDSEFQSYKNTLICYVETLKDIK